MMKRIKEDIYCYLLKLKDSDYWNEETQAHCWFYFADYLTDKQIKEIFN